MPWPARAATLGSGTPPVSSRDHPGRRSMPPPQGKELDEIRARRQKLREKYLRRRGERPASTVQGVHHLALICKNVEETIQFYQRSEEHTSELQSLAYLVCRLLLEKKKKITM